MRCAPDFLTSQKTTMVETAKGVGEPPAIPGAGAIANAVRDAIGVRPLVLPIIVERVIDALRLVTRT
jgi:CO/xanthine dehydrogenase Mo-binding subunit